MKPIISWIPKPQLAKKLKIASAILAALCLLAVPFCRGDVEEDFPIFILPLFMMVFPLFFGAVIILTTRTEGKMMKGMHKDWTKLMFRGLSSKFTKAFKVSFFLLWATGMYVMIRAMFKIEDLPDFGINEGAMFALIPVMFYITCYGAYASAEMEGTNEAQQGAAPNADKPH